MYNLLMPIEKSKVSSLRDSHENVHILYLHCLAHRRTGYQSHEPLDQSAWPEKEKKHLERANL